MAAIVEDLLPKAFHIHHSWILVKGKDAERFLQGMGTNHISFCIAESKKNHGEPYVSRGFALDTKGRPVSPWTFLAWKGEIWLSVPSESKEKLMQHLDHYIIADDVSLTPEFSIQNFTRSYFVFADSNEIKKLASANLVSEAKDLVARGEIKNSKELWLPVHGGFEVWTESDLPLGHREMTQEEYTNLRIERGIPEWQQEYNSETLILEMPLDAEISFYKGCYIGQEVVARGTFRGKMPKGLARFNSAEELSLGLVYLEEAGEERPVGKITSVAKTHALGILRFAALVDAQNLFIKRSDGKKIFLSRVEALLGGPAT